MLERAAAIYELLVDLRRQLHRFPELGYEETRTAAVICEQLQRLGLEIHRPHGTAILGILRGRMSGPAVLLRAELDALPIQEVPGRSYGSEVAGRMHACGHDGHMAILVGTAMLLARQKERLDGEVWFLFQPAEEKLPEGGAKALVQAGLLSSGTVELALSLHLWPELPVGTVGIRTGPIMAAGDIFRVTFTGDGGHAAMPHTAADTVTCASHAVVALQGLARRQVTALSPIVISVAMVRAGTTANVLPTEATLAGTTRYLDSQLGIVLSSQMRSLAEAMAGIYGCQAEVDYQLGYPAIVNDPAATELVASAVRKSLGPQALKPDVNASMLSDDFSHIAGQVPSCYFWLGATHKHPIPALHSPSFDFDERALMYGAAVLAEACLAKLAPQEVRQ